MDSSIIVALIGAGVTVANVLFTTISARKQKRDERTEQLEAGVQCLLRAEIIRSHESIPSAGNARYTLRRRSQEHTRRTTHLAAMMSRLSFTTTLWNYRTTEEV